MPTFMIVLLIYMAIGSFAGFLAGLFGIGGGIILVPGFYYTLSWLYPDASHLMQVSIGTALATIIITGLSSVRAHGARGNIRKDILYKLGIGVAIGSLLSAVIADQLPSESLKTFFAVMIMALALLMISGPERIVALFQRRSNPAQTTLPNHIISTISGLIIGCVSGLMGIGGATLSVPYMSFFGIQMRQAVGTASAIGLCIAVPSVIGFIITGLSENTGLPYTLGYIYLPAWLAVISCSSVTAIYGARLAHALDQKLLKKIFGLFMIVIALIMIGDEVF